MGKNVIRLTESQLNEIIRSAADMALNEIDGKISGAPAAATTAMDDILQGISNKIVRADEMMPRAFHSFLVPNLFLDLCHQLAYLCCTFADVEACTWIVREIL